MFAQKKRFAAALALCLLLSGCVTSVNLQPPAEPPPPETAAGLPSAEVLNTERGPAALRRPTADLFGIAGGVDTALYDTALDDIWYRCQPNDLVLPGVTVYGSYEDDVGTVYICTLHYYFVYDFGTPEYCGNIGGGGEGAAIRITEENGILQGTILYKMGDGGDPNAKIRHMCGPLTNLAEGMIGGIAEGRPIASPRDVNELIRLYCAAAGQGHLLDGAVAPPEPLAHAFIDGDRLNRAAILEAFVHDREGTLRELARLYVELIRRGEDVDVVNWPGGPWEEEEANKTRAFDLLFDRETLRVEAPEPFTHITSSYQFYLVGSGPRGALRVPLRVTVSPDENATFTCPVPLYAQKSLEAVEGYLYYMNQGDAAALSDFLCGDSEAYLPSAKTLLARYGAYDLRSPEVSLAGYDVQADRFLVRVADYHGVVFEVGAVPSYDGVGVQPDFRAELRTPGDVSAVKLELGASRFTAAELEAAVEAVKEKFIDFEGCTLQVLRYDADAEAETVQYRDGGADADNLIIFFSDFHINASGGDGSLNPESDASGWMWIVVRDGKDAPWRVIDWGV